MSLCPSCNAEAGDVARFCPSCGATIMRMAGQSDDYTGRIIAGKFRVEKLLGEGGMGKVYKATQLSLDKAVVLKVLRQTLLSDSRTVARFQREAKAASRLNHPNSIGVIDFGQDESGAMYIAMEFVAGQDLHQLLSSEGPLPESRIVRIVSQVLSALTEAHAAGVIHRDLKPENIMVEQRRGEGDFVKVLDFGIAKIQESDGSEGAALTRAGFVCGTPEYMSPEQARGAALDPRSDLYAVGVIMYQCATGQLPFDSDSAVGFATKHLTEEPLPPRRKRPDAFISDAMEALILKAMAKDPNDRPQTAEEFRTDLLAIVESSHDRTVAGPRLATGRQRVVTSGPARVPSWNSNPPAPARGQALQRTSSEEEEEVTHTSVSPEPAARGKIPKTALIAGGAGLGVALLLGVGTLVFLQPPRPPERIPLPEAEAVVETHGADGPSKHDPEGAKAFAQQGEDALAARNYDEALLYFRQAHDADPSPAMKKRIALVYLMRRDSANAEKWLKDYASVSSAADVPFVQRYLKTGNRRAQ